MKCRHAAQLLRIIMVLGNVFGYTVKMPAPASTPSTVINWRKFAAAQAPPDQMTPPATYRPVTRTNLDQCTGRRPQGRFCQRHIGEVVQQSRNYRTLIDGRQVENSGRRSRRSLSLVV